MHIFSGLYKSRKILCPKGIKTRPTSGRLREALFNICQSKVQEAEFLDLFAGSGAMGIEALSRGARHVTFVDNSRESIRCLHTNLEALDIESCCKVIFADVFSSLRKLAKTSSSFDIIYADPPYDQQAPGKKHAFSTEILVILDELIASGSSLLKAGGSIFLEEAPEALPKNLNFKHLFLIDQRTMGRSALQHWQLAQTGEER